MKWWKEYVLRGKFWKQNTFLFLLLQNTLHTPKFRRYHVLTKSKLRILTTVLWWRLATAQSNQNLALMTQLWRHAILKVGHDDVTILAPNLKLQKGRNFRAKCMSMAWNERGSFSASRRAIEKYNLSIWDRILRQIHFWAHWNNLDQSDVTITDQSNMLYFFGGESKRSVPSSSFVILRL